MSASSEAHVERVIGNSLDQVARVRRQNSTGMVWLHVPNGMVLDRPEAWELARALMMDEEPVERRVDQSHVMPKPSPIRFPWQNGQSRG